MDKRWQARARGVAGGCLSLLLAVHVARARAEATQVDHAPGAPACETARCLAEDDEPVSDALLWPVRVLLRPPRLLVDATSRLVLLGARLEDEHQISHHVTGAFFDESRTFGVFPTAFVETGLEPSIGLRLVHRALGSHRETLRLRGAYGGPETQLYEGQVHTGRRFARTRLTLLASYQRREDGVFFGIGNADLALYSNAERPQSALAHDTAVATHFRSEQGRVVSDVAHALRRNLSVGALQQLRVRALSTGAERSVTLTDGGTPWATQVFTPDSLVGMNETSVDVYYELRAAWDSRRSTRSEQPRSLPSEGTRAVTWVGGQSTLSPRRGVFGRVGFDVQRWLDLGHGDRVLRLRLRSAWVVGELEDVTFTDLPSLGGAALLRGYRNARFRDRGSLLATVEYRYPVQENLAAYVFVDGGRVAASLDELSPSALREARLGFGGGIVVFSQSATLVRAQLASSVDGEVFFHFRLDTTDAPGPRY